MGSFSSIEQNTLLLKWFNQKDLLSRAFGGGEEPMLGSSINYYWSTEYFSNKTIDKVDSKPIISCNLTQYRCKQQITSFKMQNTPFVTDLTDLPHATSYKELSSYLNNIKSKLSYADFKQRITLLQNYEPLSKIIRRTKALKQQHEEKFKEDEGLFDWYQQEKKDTQAYLKKLETDLIALKQKIEVTSWKKEELKSEVDERKKILKGILNENKQILYQFLDNKQIPKSLDISVNEKKRAWSYNSLAGMKEGKIRSRKLSSHTQQQSHKVLGNSLKTMKSNKSSSSQNRYLYEQCLLHLTKSIKANTSSDVQSGIFLDILQTSKIQNSLKNRKDGIISNNLIYQVLLNSYKQSQRKTNQKNEEQIKIQWETFRRFNGKQVFGLLLVKEGGAQIIKGLCKNWD